MTAPGSRALLLELGMPVRCTDGVAGELADVVVDPVKRRMTHLVVRPHRLVDAVRLVPLELVAAGEVRREICLSLSLEELAGLESVQTLAYLGLDAFPARVDDPGWDVGVEDVLVMPYYEAAELGDYVGEFATNVAVTYDRVPKGTVEIRRSSAVESADGDHLGHVAGLVVDGEDVTHVVLERGRLWGRRDITIPIRAVARVETDAVILGLSKDEIGMLPAVRVRRRPLG